MKAATVNKICLLPGIGTLIGAGTIAYHLPLAVFKSSAIGVGFFSKFLPQNKTLNEQTSSIRRWYEERGAALKTEVPNHLKQVVIGLIRLLPVIGAIFLVWQDFCETLPSEAYTNRLCIVPGLGTVIGVLTLMDNPPTNTIAHIFCLVIVKGIFALNILEQLPEEGRVIKIEDYNQLKEQTTKNVRMTIIGFIRLIPVVGGAMLVLNDCYQIIPLDRLLPIPRQC
jgi:hypothetical protein